MVATAPEDLASALDTAPEDDEAAVAAVKATNSSLERSLSRAAGSNAEFRFATSVTQRSTE